MVAPLVAAAIKYGAGKLLDSQGLPSGLVDPKGFIVDKLKSAADTALDLPSGTTSFIADPKGALIGAAKDYAQNEVMDAIRGGGGGGKPNTDEELSSASEAFKRGGKVRRTSKSVSKTSTSKASTPSRRGDGIAQRGKTRGRMV